MKTAYVGESFITKMETNESRVDIKFLFTTFLNKDVGTQKFF